MSTRDCPVFALATALSRPSPGLLSSWCWHFWMARKLAGVNSFRSDYPVIFMPIQAVLLSTCGRLRSGVQPSSSLTLFILRASARWPVFHSPRLLHSHGWNSFFAHPRCPTCACFHVRENHGGSQFSVIALPLAGTAERYFLLHPESNIRVGIGWPQSAIRLCDCDRYGTSAMRSGMYIHLPSVHRLPERQRRCRRSNRVRVTATVTLVSPAEH